MNREDRFIASCPSWEDLLGTGRRYANWRPFKEAREFVRKLGLKSESEWRNYVASRKSLPIFRPVPNLVMPNPVGLAGLIGSGQVRRSTGEPSTKRARLSARSACSPEPNGKRYANRAKNRWIFRPVLKLFMPNLVGLAGLIGSALDVSIGTIKATSRKRVHSSANSA